jgi:hypothetical protein
MMVNLANSGTRVRIAITFNEKPETDLLSPLLLEFARRSGVTPFSADTFWRQHQFLFRKSDVQRQLDNLFARNRVVRLNDSRFLSVEAVDQIKQRVAAAIDRKGFVTIRDCKGLFGYGRWGGAHVLDHLNKIKFTVRRGDKHYKR